MGWMKDETGLDKTAANHIPLTPLSHLRRAAQVFADHTAVVYGNERYLYSELFKRCSRLASALAAKGIAPGDVVATLLPNVPAQVEAHFGVPACGAVLNTINTRLDVGTVHYIFGHGEAKAVLVDPQFTELAEAACEGLATPPILIEVPDAVAGVPATGRHDTYESFLTSGDPAFEWIMPQDEWKARSTVY